MAAGSAIRLSLLEAAKAVEEVEQASIAYTGLGVSDFTIMEALQHKTPYPSIKSLKRCSYHDCCR